MGNIIDFPGASKKEEASTPEGPETHWFNTDISMEGLIETVRLRDESIYVQVKQK